MEKPDRRTSPYRDDFAAESLKDIVDVKAYGSPIRHQVCMPVAPLHRKAATSSMMDSQLLLGTEFDVYDLKGSWAWGQEVQADGAGYVGYVPKMTLVPVRSQPTHRISVLRSPVFIKPDLKSAIRIVLPLNARVEIVGEDEEYLNAADLGFIHKNHLKDLAETGGDYVAIAELHLGLPYIWGGISSDGVDCSGLVQSALRAVGCEAPRDSDMQEQALGKSIDPDSDLKRGDLVFWKGHVGIMLDSGTLLHANAHHMLIASEPLNEAARRIEKTAGPITSIKRMD